MNSQPETKGQAPQTLFEKIWRRHAIPPARGRQTLLYVDSHFLQDGSAPAFEMLRQRGSSPGSATRLRHPRSLRSYG